MIFGKQFDFETRSMAYFRQLIKKEIQNRKIEEIISTFESEEMNDQNVNESTENMSNDEEPVEVVEEDSVDENIPPMFENQSGTICWLNSIVQLLMITIDEYEDNSPLKKCF